MSDPTNLPTPPPPDKPFLKRGSTWTAVGAMILQASVGFPPLADAVRPLLPEAAKPYLTAFAALLAFLSVMLARQGTTTLANRVVPQVEGPAPKVGP